MVDIQSLIEDGEDEVYIPHAGWIKLNAKEETAQYTTDELLDQYRDYITLHAIFGDSKYKEAADNVIKDLNNKLMHK